MAFELTQERQEIFAEMVPRYPTKRALTIPLLHLCQEQHGWISPEVMDYCAKKLELSTADVLGVGTFYTMFQQKKVGRNVGWVCRTLSCELRGGAEITRALESKLGCHVGETTADGEFTLLKAECLAACGQGPMIQVNDEFHEDLTVDKLDAILDAARKNRDPRSAVGFSPVGLRIQEKK